MDKEIYLDNSSTTMVCKSAIDKMVDIMNNNYGNPASLHTKGICAEKEINIARENIAKTIKCTPQEIYFTSGGTESNNLAIFGAVKSKHKLGNKIITTTIEHPSVLNCIHELENNGFDVIYLHPDCNGIISDNDIMNAIDSKTILVSIMLVNNEIGSIQNINTAAKAINKHTSPALLHVDAVQAFGKLPIKVNKLGVDLLSISSHKIHGPKGIGALYIKKGVNLRPITFGGGQENGLRSGTLATQSIAGLGEAVNSLPNIDDEFEKISKLNTLATSLLKDIPNISMNSSIFSIPYILNFSVGNIRSETLLHFLASKNIFVSSGSACAKGKPSYVLSEIGLDKNRIDSSIRVSFSRYNTEDDVYCLANALKEALHTLVTR